jgi:phosphate transport system substrate-binding protein
MPKYRCINDPDLCENAKNRTVITLPEGAECYCPSPECGLELVRIQDKRIPKWPVALALLAVVGFAVWYMFRPAPPATILRLAGSGTIGARLVPALVNAYFLQKGATKINETHITHGDRLTITVGTKLPGRGRVVVEISMPGTAEAFDALADGSADIGMASRMVKQEERDKLPSNLIEHVVGLDSIAVIVHPSNPAGSISKKQLAEIFSGKASEWVLGGQQRTINVYAIDKSEAYDTFKNLVLADAPLAPRAQHCEDSKALADFVARDTNGIGFVGRPYVHKAKAVAVSEKGARALQPVDFNVSTEDYPLSSRLYLYTRVDSENPDALDFVDFAISDLGQDVVSNAGFVGRGTGIGAPPDACLNAPPDYARLTGGAMRMALNFRFQSGSSELDSKAMDDLDSVVGILGGKGVLGPKVMLFGFADSVGELSFNRHLSQVRVDAVKSQLMARGVAPGVSKGFGVDCPVASDDTPEGREKNRRVEIWIKDIGAI